jgi:DNA-binding response OmpR family regulator
VETKVLIFVVEDEEAIQEVLKYALEDAGFAVSAASSGEDAMKMLDTNGEFFRALVSDVNLGSPTTGWDVAKRARELIDQLAVVYVTANGHEWGSKGVPNSVLLPKPFAGAQLVTAISQLLNLGNTPGT